MKHRYCWALPLSLLLTAGAARGDEKSAADIIAEFEAQWTAESGSMRPLDDPGWKARMTAFRHLAALGEDAEPALRMALDADAAETRAFAAQALTYLAQPETEPALRDALTDSNALVRLYAVDALGMLTPPADDPIINKLANSDQNRDVKAHAQFVLERDDEPDLKSIREQLAEYDLSQLATAQLNEEAPDFELKDPLGNAYQLSDFRGKKSVVLVFVYGDT